MFVGHAPKDLTNLMTPVYDLPSMISLVTQKTGGVANVKTASIVKRGSSSAVIQIGTVRYLKLTR